MIIEWKILEIYTQAQKSICVRNTERLWRMIECDACVWQNSTEWMEQIWRPNNRGAFVVFYWQVLSDTNLDVLIIGYGIIEL